MDIGIPITVCIGILAVIAYKKGNSPKEIWDMFLQGGKKSLGILKIFIFLGAIGSVWIYSGTLPALIYYCLNYIIPQLFILFCFLCCCGVSYLNGSSFGTTGTIGIAFITLAKATGIPADLVAGAIISGAYFGDRGSPVSSAAALVAALTNTEQPANVRRMHRSVVLPMVLSVIVYGGASFLFPLSDTSSDMGTLMRQEFVLSVWVLLPAVVLFLLPMFRVNVLISMGTSVVLGLLLAVFVQKIPVMEVLPSLLFGVEFQAAGLEHALSSGGIYGMLETYVVVFLSCALAGLLSGIHVLDNLKVLLRERVRPGRGRLIATSVVSVFTCACGCNQTIGTILTCEIMEDSYKDEQSQLALDVGNSTLVIAGLIPWSIASFVPTGLLGVSRTGYLPFAFFMYAIPLCAILFYKRTGTAR